VFFVFLAVSSALSSKFECEFFEKVAKRIMQKKLLAKK
jgi:hypothetical protein